MSSSAKFFNKRQRIIFFPLASTPAVTSQYWVQILRFRKLLIFKTSVFPSGTFSSLTWSLETSSRLSVSPPGEKISNLIWSLLPHLSRVTRRLLWWDPPRWYPAFCRWELGKQDAEWWEMWGAAVLSPLFSQLTDASAGRRKEERHSFKIIFFI